MLSSEHFNSRTWLPQSCQQPALAVALLTSLSNGTRTPSFTSASITKRAGLGMLTSRLARPGAVSASGPAVLHNHLIASAWSDRVLYSPYGRDEVQLIAGSSIQAWQAAAGMMVSAAACNSCEGQGHSTCAVAGRVQRHACQRAEPQTKHEERVTDMASPARLRQLCFC
jgi:hypothetical protein